MLDRETIDGLRQLGAGVLAEMIDMYLEDTPPRLAELRAAIGAGDARRVRDLAHTIKGSTANFGAAALVELCRTLEDRARSGDLQSGPAGLAAIEAEFAQVRTALVRERAT